jgi:hypothetical protein
MARRVAEPAPGRCPCRPTTSCPQPPLRRERAGAGRRIVVVAAALLAVSCATGADRYVADEQFDHRGRRRHVEPALTLEVVVPADRAERSELRGVVTSPWLPGTEISGIIEVRPDGGRAIYVTRVRLLANWANGWTEAVYEASGLLSLAPVRSGYTLRVDEPVELWTLEEGSIRYYDTYLLGDDGLSRVRARVDRLTEVARWMRERGGPDAYGSDDRAGRYGPAMADEVRRAVGDEIEAGTAPEWLVPLDASRSLERDLREASRLLVTLYNLGHFNGELAGSLTLREK